MNTKNRNLILGVILGILVVLSLEPYWQPVVAKLVPIMSMSQTLVKTDLKQVDQISIFIDGDEFKLTKSDTGWTIGDLPASQKKIQDLFDALSQMTNPILVSNNQEKLSTYGLADGREIRLNLGAGDSQETMFVGAAGSRSGTFYFKKDGDDSVFQVEGNLRTTLANTSTYWQDTLLSDTDPSQIRSVTYYYSDSDSVSIGFDAEEKRWFWSQADKKAVLNQQIESQVTQALDPLEATSIAEESVVEGLNFDNPDRKMVIKNTNGESTTLLFLANEKDWFVTKQGDDRIFVITDFAFNKFFPEKEELIKS